MRIEFMSNNLEFAKNFAKDAYDASELIVVDNKQYTKIYSTADGAYSSGIKGAIYQNGNEYIVAFSGLNPVYSPNDIQAITDIINGNKPTQFDDALDFINKSNIDVSKISLITGQSLGGAICQLIGSTDTYKDIPVVTINPIGAGDVIKKKPELFKSNDNSNIKNYICDQDDATKWSSQVGEKISLPTYGLVDQLYDFANRGSNKDSEKLQQQEFWLVL